jgi:hypothetical protein
MANRELCYRKYYTLFIKLTTTPGTQIIWHRMGENNKFVRISMEMATVSGVWRMEVINKALHSCELSCT